MTDAAFAESADPFAEAVDPMADPGDADRPSALSERVLNQDEIEQMIKSGEQYEPLFA